MHAYLSLRARARSLARLRLIVFIRLFLCPRACCVCGCFC
jgi:hypothetical protein